MRNEPGRFNLPTAVSRRLLMAKGPVTSTVIDDIARRRERRTTSQADSHVSLGEAIARQRQRETQGL